jgi:mannosyltransferase
VTESIARAPAGGAAAARRTHALARAVPFVPVLAAVLVLAAYAVVAAGRPLSTDEAAAVQAASEPLGEALEQALSHDPGQVADRALLHAAAAVDRSEPWLRAPSFLAVLAALALVSWLAWMLAGRRAGVAAGAIFGIGAGAAEVSQLARPYAPALAAVALSSCLFVRALRGGGIVAWTLYALVSALLPLVHPGAATALLAHGAALVVARSSLRRLALPLLAVLGLVAGLLVVASAVDRHDASGDGDASLETLAIGLGRAVGWSPVVVALGVFGVVALARGRRAESTWQATLVGGLAAAPLIALLVVGVGLPVFPRYALVLCAPGVAVAAGIGLDALADRTLVPLVAGGVAVVALAAIVATASTPMAEDWRSAARLVRETRGVRETVVVLPPRARAALAYYAPFVRVHDAARGDGAWLVVATAADPRSLARTAVTTPRYALLDERQFGDDLVVQHWVRP